MLPLTTPSTERASKAKKDAVALVPAKLLYWRPQVRRAPAVPVRAPPPQTRRKLESRGAADVAPTPPLGSTWLKGMAAEAVGEVTTDAGCPL
jgi:hypothetical protein